MVHYSGGISRSMASMGTPPAPLYCIYNPVEGQADDKQSHYESDVERIQRTCYSGHPGFSLIYARTLASLENKSAVLFRLSLYGGDATS
jgi:hypothetical protein